MLSILRRSITPVTDKRSPSPSLPSIRNRGTNRNEFRARYNRVIRDTTYQLNEFRSSLSLSFSFFEELWFPSRATGSGKERASLPFDSTLPLHLHLAKTLWQSRYESDRGVELKELKKVERRTLSFDVDPRGCFSASWNYRWSLNRHLFTPVFLG